MLGAAFSVPAAVELLTREITELAEKSRLTINLDRDKLEEAVVEAAEAEGADIEAVGSGGRRGTARRGEFERELLDERV